MSYCCQTKNTRAKLGMQLITDWQSLGVSGIISNVMVFLYAHVIGLVEL